MTLPEQQLPEPEIQDPTKPIVPQPGEVRSQLMAGVANAQMEPNLAQIVYQQLGFHAPGVSVTGYQASVADLQPGDIVGWHGGQEPDGRYVGNLAMLVGPREILESYYGTTRRRKLNDNENVFGMPVMQSGNVLAAPTGGTNGEAQLSTPVAGEV